MRQLLDYTDQSRRVLSASAKHLPRRASDQTRPHSIIANYSSHYARFDCGICQDEDTNRNHNMQKKKRQKEHTLTFLQVS